jgi:UDP-N-acetylglucosamine acyltransferase
MIHRSALVDPTAQLGEDVSVGPFAILGPNVVIGDQCHIAAHVVIERNTRLGTGVRIGYGSVLGADPQDLKYKGEETWVEIATPPSSASIAPSTGAPPRPVRLLSDSAVSS